MEQKQPNIVYKNNFADMREGLYRCNMRLLRSTKRIPKIRIALHLYFFLCFYLPTRDFRIVLYSLVLTEILLWLFQRWGMRFLVYRSARMTYAEAKNPALYAERRLEADSEGITITSSYAVNRFAWAAITDFDTDEKYTYLGLGSAQFVLITHSGILSGDIRDVLEQIKQHYDPSKQLTLS